MKLEWDFGNHKSGAFVTLPAEDGRMLDVVLYRRIQDHHELHALTEVRIFGLIRVEYGSSPRAKRRARHFPADTTRKGAVIIRVRMHTTTLWGFLSVCRAGLPLRCVPNVQRHRKQAAVLSAPTLRLVAVEMDAELERACPALLQVIASLPDEPARVQMSF